LFDPSQFTSQFRGQIHPINHIITPASAAITAEDSSMRANCWAGDIARMLPEDREAGVKGAGLRSNL
jgi:hypothetical protein